MKHVIVVDIADLANRLAGNVFDIELGPGGDLAADNHDVGLDVGFTGDAAEFVLREAGIEDRVRNRIRDFIRMTLADGFRGKNVSIAHSRSKKKARDGSRAYRDLDSSASLRPASGGAIIGR
jgi:hypothetical protein